MRRCWPRWKRPCGTSGHQYLGLSRITVEGEVVSGNMRRPDSAGMLQPAWNSILPQLVAALSHDLDPSMDGRSMATLPLFFNRHGLHQAPGPAPRPASHSHGRALPCRTRGPSPVPRRPWVGGCSLDPVHAAHPTVSATALTSALARMMCSSSSRFMPASRSRGRRAQAPCATDPLGPARLGALLRGALQ